MEQVEFQREVVRRIFTHLGQDSGFALAGSGAIREYGLMDRPTEDIDLFTNKTQGSPVQDIVEDLVRALINDGYSVSASRVSATFARLDVSKDGYGTQVDLGVDWRLQPPRLHEIGSVLAIEDAVANKVCALYSRGVLRDYLDVDSIRSAGRFTDEELLMLAEQSDPGFDREYFAQALEASRGLSLGDAEPFSLSSDDLAGLVERCTQWATRIRESMNLKERIYLRARELHARDSGTGERARRDYPRR